MKMNSKYVVGVTTGKYQSKPHFVPNDQLKPPVQYWSRIDKV